MEYGFWLLGFIAPLIRGVNPPLKPWVAAALTVFLILDRLLVVASHTPRIDRAILIPAEHAIALKLEQQSRAFLLRYPGKAGELLFVNPPAIDEQRPIRLGIMHNAHHLSP
ncbi:hypothetical protein CWO90_35210 [Bradyrhizobium sp. Leo121]|nr:hypothetical protein CWO90_35210 [Bradyrhizobium sp. Leo121]